MKWCAIAHEMWCVYEETKNQVLSDHIVVLGGTIADHLIMCEDHSGDGI